MGKEILKKKGRFKIALSKILSYGLPIGGVVIGGFGGTGCWLAQSTVQSNVEADYKNSQTYISIKADEIEELNRSLDSGKIKEYDYNKQREYLDSDEYRDELLSRNYPQDYEYQARLKTADKLGTAAWSIVATGAGITAIGMVLLCTGVMAKIYDSVERDIYNSYTVSTNPPPPKIKKKKGKIEEANEEKDEEEQLMDIEDYMAQYQGERN